MASSSYTSTGSTGTTSSRFTLPDLPPAPNHPADNFVFPKKSFGKKQIVWRSCQAPWFKRWPYLHYDAARDCLFCYTCVEGFKKHKMLASFAEPSLISKIIP